MTRQAIGAAIRPASAASHLAFIGEPANVVLIGPNGLGKTMRAKNLTHQAVLHGHTARFTLASDLLHDLAAQDSSTALARRLRRYTSPTVLAIDEVGYLSYDARYPKSQIPRQSLAQRVLVAMMQPNDLPLVCLPTHLSDEAAAQLLEFLHELTATLENHYYGQLHRYYSATDHQQNDRPSQSPRTNPAFACPPGPDTGYRPGNVATIRSPPCDVRSHHALSTKITRFCNPVNTMLAPTTTTPSNRCACPCSRAKSVNRIARRTALRHTPS